MTMFLIVDDSAVDRRLVGELLRKRYDCAIEYAADGAEALARLGTIKPDLVVTDLSMPMQSGLELVRELRVRAPNIPVILMTAYGSESLALEALEQGAASYVPKSQLVSKLPDTVEDVLTRAEADRKHRELMRCARRTEFSFVLENEPTLIDPLVNLVQETISGMGFGDFYSRLQVAMALKQALLNALFHGNLEISQEQMQEVSDMLIGADEPSLVERRRAESPYSERRIYADVSLLPDELRFVIRDEGKGFDTSAIPDPSKPGTLAQEGGRGLSLMRTFMDEVKFNESGNEVTMVKHRVKRGPDGRL